MANKSDPTEIRENSADLERRGITAAVISEGLAHTKRMKAAPGYAERERKRIAEVERRAKLKPTRFPSLAKGTRPALTGVTAGEARTRHAKNILARVERNTPNI